MKVRDRQGLEFLLLLILLPIAIGLRVLFGVHWRVEVRRGFRFVHEEPAGSWRESGERIRTLAEELRTGTGTPSRVIDSDR